MSAGILVHEWLAPSGGSENVFEVLCETYPDAERWCLWNDAGERFEPIHETALARTPLRRHKAVALMTMPTVWRHLPARDAEWMLVSSHLFAHHARFGGSARNARKYVYAHTPARYIWAPELDDRGGSPLARVVASALKPVDRRRSAEAYSVAGNSQFVADRIARTWGREARVIYPPVDVALFADPPVLAPADSAQAAALPAEYLLGFSRFVPYKQLERAIEAGKATGLPVVIAGGGPDEQRLRSMGDQLHPGMVHFVINPSTPLLSHLYRRALALIFAPIEDFGIVPVEAMASGTAVVAGREGGVAESVLDGVSGALVSDWSSPSEVRDAVARAISCDPAAASQRAQVFGVSRFQEAVRSWVGEE